MSGEKKHQRWRPSPILIEEKIKIDSKSITTSTRTEEEKHTENTIRKWYNDDDDDDESNQSEVQSTILSPNRTISERIERVLRKINAWTNETISTPNNSSDNNTPKVSIQDKSFNKSKSSEYDNVYQKQGHRSRSEKEPSNISSSTFRQRCSSSTHAEPNMIKNQQIPFHRPYSMTFTNEPLSSMKINDTKNYVYEGLDRKVRRRISRFNHNYLSSFAL